MKENTARFGRRLFVIGFWILVWQLGAHAVDNHIILVGPWDTVLALGRLIPDWEFWRSIAYSFGKITLGFLSGFGAGVFLGSLGYRLTFVKDLLKPVMVLLKSIPVASFVILALIWALIPIGNAFAFASVPMAPLIEDGESGLQLKELFGLKIFWVLLVMMICAGASEQAVSQWASTFAEKGLGISKTAGDLAGPLAFALLMGTSRLFYGRYGDRIDLDRFMVYSCCLCILSYLGISLLPMLQLSLAACAVCGLSVGIMWPGTFSKASAALPKGGTAMFALLALGGDIGCSGGPTLVGMVSGALGDDLKMGVLAGILFPVLLLVGVILCGKTKKEIIKNS